MDSGDIVIRESRHSVKSEELDDIYIFIYSVSRCIVCDRLDERIREISSHLCLVVDCGDCPDCGDCRKCTGCDVHVCRIYHIHTEIREDSTDGGEDFDRLHGLEYRLEEFTDGSDWSVTHIR